MTSAFIIRSQNLNFREVFNLLAYDNIAGWNLIPELRAVVSHWLHHPDISYPYCSDNMRRNWGEVIYKHLCSDMPSEAVFRMPASLNDLIIRKGIPFPPPLKSTFTFIDMFAGIGGFRIALQNLGGSCVFSCEWDAAAKETYFNNFGEYPFGDIRQFTSQRKNDASIDKMIPKHDILAAGFPCQPFSRAGVSARKSLGQKHGFKCRTQGTLFFDIARIIKVKKPKAVFLENVKNLRGHNQGETLKIIRETIEKELGYSYSCEVINSSSLVPQRRERCYIVCFRNKKIKFKFPDISGNPIPLRVVLEKNVDRKFTISKRLWQGHINRTKRNLERGVGFTAHLADLDKPANTLVARYGKDGKECLIPQKGKTEPRMLTPRECARLQGFPDSFVIPEQKTKAYRQFGNSVTVPVISKIAEAIVKYL